MLHCPLWLLFQGDNAEEFPADNGEDEEEEEEEEEATETPEVPDAEGEATQVTEEPPQYDENTQQLIEGISYTILGFPMSFYYFFYQIVIFTFNP